MSNTDRTKTHDKSPQPDKKGNVIRFTTGRETPPRIRLVVVDDHMMFLQGLVALLSEEGQFQVIAQATSGKQAIEEIKRHHPDIALIDISMPDMSGLEVARTVQGDMPDVKVLMLTMHEEERLFFEALKQGASGYFLKGASSDELISAILAIHEGDVYIPPSLATYLVKDFVERGKSSNIKPIEPLSPREEQVLRLIAQGLTNYEIADELTITFNTVKTHRLRIYQKLGFHKRSQLLAFAMQKGLLS